MEGVVDMGGKTAILTDDATTETVIATDFWYFFVTSKTAWTCLMILTAPAVNT